MSLCMPTKKIRTSTSGLRKSPNKWTKEENQKLAALVAHYGEKKWKRISAEMGGQKTGAQCAQHWKRVLSPEIRKGHWDENEEDLLLRLVVQYGSSWKKIAKRIPQRTDIQCRYQYLKAKQSREVKWDMKEDETLIKKVMEMANCNIFKHHGGGDNNTSSPPGGHPYIPNSLNHSNHHHVNSSTNGSASPASNKENETDNHMHSSSNSDISDDRSSSEEAESSGDGEETPDGGWGSKCDDVSMKDSPEISSRQALPPSLPNQKEGASSPHGFALNKVVWLEIAEHMARMKLTSTLRTALECKTRFMELLGNIIFAEGGNPSGPDAKMFHFKGSGDLSMNSFTSRGSSPFASTPTSTSTSSPSPQETLRASSSRIPAAAATASGGGGADKDTNINISINNSSSSDLRTLHPLHHPHPHHMMTNNNITITNCSRNITINITNNHPALPPPTSNPTPFPSPFHLPTALPIKQEASKAPTAASSSFPSFPSFPSFSHHFPPVGQSMTAVPPPKSSISRNGGGGMASGLDSLAAVASILPREMLAEHYAQF